jgi:hypothetical protein
MIKKIIIYHFLLFLIVALFSCAPRTHVAPKPIEKNNKFMTHLLRNIITQGLDF